MQQLLSDCAAPLAAAVPRRAWRPRRHCLYGGSAARSRPRVLAARQPTRLRLPHAAGSTARSGSGSHPACPPDCSGSYDLDSGMGAIGRPSASSVSVPKFSIGTADRFAYMGQYVSKKHSKTSSYFGKQSPGPATYNTRGGTNAKGLVACHDTSGRTPPSFSFGGDVNRPSPFRVRARRICPSCSSLASLPPATGPPLHLTRGVLCAPGLALARSSVLPADGLLQFCREGHQPFIPSTILILDGQRTRDEGAWKWHEHRDLPGTGVRYTRIARRWRTQQRRLADIQVRFADLPRAYRLKPMRLAGGLLSCLLCCSLDRFGTSKSRTDYSGAGKTPGPGEYGSPGLDSSRHKPPRYTMYESYSWRMNKAKKKPASQPGPAANLVHESMVKAGTVHGGPNSSVKFAQEGRWEED